MKDYEFEKQITVRELIKYLKEFSQDSVVWSYSQDNCAFCNHIEIIILNDNNIAISANTFSNEKLKKYEEFQCNNMGSK